MTRSPMPNLASRLAHSANVQREAKSIKAPWPTRVIWVPVDVGPSRPIGRTPVTVRAMPWDAEVSA